MCAKKAGKKKKATPVAKPPVPPEPIVLVGVFDVDADPTYFHLSLAPGSNSYYRIPLAKAEFTLNANVEFRSDPPPRGQAVIVRIEDHSTLINCVQSVAANYLKGEIARTQLALATTAPRLMGAVGIGGTSEIIGCE